jgi:hypothetical protein
LRPAEIRLALADAIGQASIFIGLPPDAPCPVTTFAGNST